MERRRPKRVPPDCRRGRLIARKKKRAKRLRILLTIVTILLISTLALTIKKIYITKNCNSLQFAVDYYFTNWENKNLRLLHVEKMTLVDKDKKTATVEAYGLTYEEPRHRTTLIGSFKKAEKGDWVMNSVKVSPSTELNVYN